MEPNEEEELTDGTSADLPRVALLVDYPVLLRAIHGIDADAGPDIPKLVARACALGPLYCARAYGAWYDVDDAQQAFTSGLDPVFVPPVGPGAVPTTTALVADGLNLIRSGQAQILALSGDDRLLPLVALARSAGVAVEMVAHSCAVDGPVLHLAQAAEPAAAFLRVPLRSERYRRKLGPAAKA